MTFPTFPAASTIPAVAAAIEFTAQVKAFRAEARTRLDGTIVKPRLATAMAAVRFPAVAVPVLEGGYEVDRTAIVVDDRLAEYYVDGQGWAVCELR